MCFILGKYDSAQHIHGNTHARRQSRQSTSGESATTTTTTTMSTATGREVFPPARACTISTRICAYTGVTQRARVFVCDIFTIHKYPQAVSRVCGSVANPLRSAAQCRLYCIAPQNAVTVSLTACRLSHVRRVTTTTTTTTHFAEPPSC